MKKEMLLYSVGATGRGAPQVAVSGWTTSVAAAFTAVAALPAPRPRTLKSLKICGVTNADDAFWIVEAIQKRFRTQIWIGCVAWKHSRRRVSVEEARAVAAAVREASRSNQAQVRTVAVFVDEDLSEISEVCSAAAIDVAQLHGSLSWQEGLLRAHHPQAWPPWLDYARVLRPNSNEVEPYKRATATRDGRGPCYTLIDPGRGDGKPFDWQHFAGDLLLGPNPGLWMLAGGLNVDNVAEAIRYTDAPGIDVASGVEMILKSPSSNSLKVEHAQGVSRARSAETSSVRPRKDRERLEALLDVLCSVYDTNLN
jgi:phosphoribosylanthranilate isomerase